ncbi:hypothetical protein FHT85_004065 [Rhizobium sp. BK312]|uniref:hypothetical protein n=1 Tax=Rhizobium sp. BK312 TaxID=2587080 RepID=UPI000DD91F33|nr:hypothetical protein [Rhizobium sp. BK312]MBB3427064.1 hypothetical protein [Rhizobium sp. BK312]
MFRILFLTAAIVTCSNALAADDKTANPFSNYRANEKRERQENLFRCAAAYGIWMKIAEERNDADNAQRYNARFEKLSKDAQNSFEAVGKGEDEADNHLQKHVDTLVKLATSDGHVLPALKTFCDKELP